jgi:hypothetical protein
LNTLLEIFAGNINRIYRSASLKLDPNLPSKHMYQNLRGLGFLKVSNTVILEVDVNRMNDFFLTKVNRDSDIDSGIPHVANVPEFSLLKVFKAEECHFHS